MQLKTAQLAFVQHSRRNEQDVCRYGKIHRLTKLSLSLLQSVEKNCAVWIVQFPLLMQPVKDVFLDLVFAVNHCSLPLWIALGKLRLHN